MRYVGPLLDPSTPPITSSLISPPHDVVTTGWHTLISSASYSGSPPSSEAGDWLNAKFKAKTDDDVIEEDGVIFESTTVGRFDELPVSFTVGLVVFEASLRTYDSRKSAE